MVNCFLKIPESGPTVGTTGELLGVGLHYAYATFTTEAVKSEIVVREKCKQFFFLENHANGKETFCVSLTEKAIIDAKVNKLIRHENSKDIIYIYRVSQDSRYILIFLNSKKKWNEKF